MSADRAMPLPSTLAHPEVGPKIFNETWIALDQARAAEVAAADRAILAELESRASRPSLWRRAGEQVGRWFDSDAACVVVLLLALAALVALPVMAGHR